LLLAHEFQQISWRKALASISSSELNDWKKYFYEKGFRYEMDNWRMGSICASIWNVTLKKDEWLSPDTFYKVPEPVEKTEDELIAAGSMIPGGIRIG